MPDAPAMPMGRRGIGLACTSTAAIVGLAALVAEARISFDHSFERGRGIAEATFLYLRYFTILTNIALVVLHATTALRLARRRPLPHGSVFDACLVYAIVTGATYEVLLRSSWSPQGTQFVSDLMLHDVVPALTFAVWLLVAPRRGVRWRDPFAMLAYPAAYLAMTLAAGGYGEGYPYDFLNVARIGLADVLWVSLAFLGLFLALGFLVTASAKGLGAVDRRSSAAS